MNTTPGIAQTLMALSGKPFTNMESLIILKFHKCVIHKFVKLIHFCYLCPQIQQVREKSFVYGVA